ncbi:MAG: DUF1622 domain-containing protein [Dehalococcoidales bacterium]|nr:DUF1622 domain-containing protein [Dehalococcoidales bacterium]
MQQIVDYVALGIGVIAALLIVYGVLLGIIEVIRAEWHEFSDKENKPAVFEEIRYDIGFHLLLGLEFLIAADIIRSILRPTLEELAILGGLVAIRTVISYFLGKEIRRKD